MVEIEESAYQDFTKNCCIDCNKLIAKPLGELCEQWTRKEIRPQRDIPPNILMQLIKGIMESPLVAQEDKDRVSPQRQGHTAAD